jgi:hypothetical protein
LLVREVRAKLSSHVGDGAAEMTWPRCDVEAKSLWQRCCRANLVALLGLVTMRPRCAVIARLGAAVDRPGAASDCQGAIVDCMGATIDLLGAIVDYLSASSDRQGATSTVQVLRHRDMLIVEASTYGSSRLPYGGRQLS